MKLISDFFPRLLPLVPGCPVPTAAQALVDAAIQFCEGTNAIRQTLGAMQTRAGTALYDMEAPGQQQIARVMGAWLGNHPLGLGGMDRIAPTDNTPGVPRLLDVHRQEDAEAQLKLWPVPDNQYPLVIDVALRPIRNATSLDDELFTRWIDALVAGACSYIYRIPAQPFSDPGAAAQRHVEFRSLVNKARTEVSLNRKSGALRIRARPLA